MSEFQKIYKIALQEKLQVRKSFDEAQVGGIKQI